MNDVIKMLTTRLVSMIVALILVVKCTGLELSAFDGSMTHVIIVSFVLWIVLFVGMLIDYIAVVNSEAVNYLLNLLRSP